MRVYTVNNFNLVITAILALGLAQAAVAKGKPVNVEVTNANPSELYQGQEDIVTITGSGFDGGSSVSFLVTGTTDDSQVVVGPVQFISDTELKATIRPKDNALPTDYDIKVQNSSGRKGKGTTLFRVKAAETACTGNEPKEPEIAYLGDDETSGDLITNDVYLSSASGCDRYLLVEDAAIKITPNNTGSTTWISTVAYIRMSLQGNRGVVSWIDGLEDPEQGSPPNVVNGLSFEFDAYGNVYPENTGGPVWMYVPRPGFRVRSSDAKFNSDGDIELVIQEAADGSLTPTQVFTYNVSTGSSEVIASGDCPVQDATGNCFQPIYSGVFWGKTADEVYFRVKNILASNDTFGIAYASRLNGGWSQPRLLLKYQNELLIDDTSLDGLILYDYYVVSTNRGGKITGMKRVTSVLDPASCWTSICTPDDGIDLPIPENRRYSKAWTSTGGVLVTDYGNGVETGIIEYANPLSGASGRQIIEGGIREFDTGY